MVLQGLLDPRILGPTVIGTYLISSYLVNTEVPEPYLDEIFHVPQAQSYCRGNFRDWDPSITTPPGLYLLNTLIAWVTRTTCSVPNLRLLNVILGSVGLPYLVRIILQTQNRSRVRGHLGPPSSSSSSSSSTKPESDIHSTTTTTTTDQTKTESYVITTFPLIFFFSLLYYTDIASLCSVLGCFALGLRGEWGWSSAIGLLSLWFRQTNIVWVGFTAIVVMLDQFEDGFPEDEQEYKSFLHPGGNGNLHITPFFRTIDLYLSSALKNPKPLLQIAFTYLPVLLAFGAFITWNQGAIVLGHQEHHTMSRHYAQGAYFLGFGVMLGWAGLAGAGAGWKRTVEEAVRLGMGNWRRRMGSLIILGLMIVAVHKGTVVHPFLLADNRHYFFYIWRRLFGLHWTVKYALTPGYLGCLWLWASILGQSRSLPSLVAFGLCTAAVLIPSPLVEPRYFLVPYTLLRINLHSSSLEPSQPAASLAWRKKRSKWLAVELAWNTMINAVTLYVFLTVKFKWEGWEGWMRFMW